MPTSPPGDRQAGFSLFEIIVVLVLMGLAAALILPSFSGGLSGLELEASARDLVTHMKHLRSEAIAQQEVYRVVLSNGDDDSSRYQLTNAYEEELKSFDLPRGAGFVLPDSAAQWTVSFYPSGRSSGGEFRLRSEAGKQLVVVVDPITGLAGVSKDLGDRP